MTRTKKQAVPPVGHPGRPIPRKKSPEEMGWRTSTGRKREAEPAAPKQEKRVRFNVPDTSTEDQDDDSEQGDFASETDQAESDTSTEDQDDDSQEGDFVFETDSDSTSEAGSTVTEPQGEADFGVDEIDKLALARRAENGGLAK